MQCRFPHIHLFLWFLLFCLNVFESAASPDQLRFQSITIEQGLSQNTITTILQDRKGFLWFGTQEGLNRYDGYSFTVYKRDPFNLESLSDNFIKCMIEDRDGIFWIGTLGGLNRFDPSTELVRRFPISEKTNGSLHRSILCIMEDFAASDRTGAGTRVLWIGTEGGGLNKLVIHKGGFTVTTFRSDADDSRSLAHDAVWSVHRDRTGLLWVGTSGGYLHLMNEADGSFTRFSLNDDDNEGLTVGHQEIRKFYEDKSGRFWIATGGGGLHEVMTRPRASGDGLRIRHFHEATIGSEVEGMLADVLSTMTEDGKGNLWLGSAVGLVRVTFDADGKMSGKRFVHDALQPSSLSYNNVISLLFDASGILWAGTFGGGVNKWSPSQEKFGIYLHSFEEEPGVERQSARGIFEDAAGDLWVGGYTGLHHIERKTGKRKVYTARSGTRRVSKYLSNNNVYSIIEDPSAPGRLWIGLEYGGLMSMDIGSETFTSFRPEPGNPNSLSDDWVYALYAEPNGTLWIGTRYSLDRLDQNRKGDYSFTRYRHEAKNPSSFNGNRVNAILKDRKGLIWVATQGGGVSTFDPDYPAKGFTHLRNNPLDKSTISSNNVKCLFEDSEGNLWLGTDGGGLNKYDPTSGSFTHFDESAGLPSDVVYGVLEDEANNLWFSSNRGLSKFQPRTGSIKNYDATDGLQSNEFNTGSYHKCRHGEMFFGGINGLNFFHPVNILDDPFVPPVYITEFRILNRVIEPGERKDGRILLTKYIIETPAVELLYSENVFSFGFAALSFSSPMKNKYMYKMEGFDQEWILTDATVRLVSYTNLDPGEYTFRVRGSNSDGVWNPKDVNLRITIVPPFWHTWWFRGIGVLLLMGSTAGTVRYISRKKLQQRVTQLERQQELDRERERISRDLHDEVGSGLTKIGLLSEILKGKLTPDAASTTTIETIAKTSREVTQSINEIIWATNPTNWNLDSFISYLHEFTVKFFEPSEIRCYVDFPETIESQALSAEILRKVFLVVKEALHNVLKHSSARWMRMEVRIHARFMIIQIADDGVGMAGGKPLKTGNGLRNMQKRMEDFGGIFQMDSEKGKGTVIRLTIPLKH